MIMRCTLGNFVVRRKIARIRLRIRGSSKLRRASALSAVRWLRNQLVEIAPCHISGLTCPWLTLVQMNMAVRQLVLQAYGGRLFINSVFEATASKDREIAAEIQSKRKF